MKPFPTIVSYYTEKTPYEEEVQNLIASCAHYGLETAIEGVPSFGTWELNCAYKPFFLLKKINELKKPILWVDADGVFLYPPRLIPSFESDLAVRMDSELPDDHQSKVISSTIFINYTPAAIKLLKLWGIECQKEILNPKRTLEFWDQIALRDAILKAPQGIRITTLPLSYSKIYDHPDDCAKVANPIIEHFQASRRFKNLIK